MTGVTPSRRPQAGRRGTLADWLDRHKADVAWLAVVGVVYGVTTIAVAIGHPEYATDRAMTIATSMAHGSLDSTLPPGSLDTVTVGDVTYQVISPLPLLPYLAFVPFSWLWESSRWIVSSGIGIAAAWMTLPLARRYGPGGPATWWLAVLGAFGTLLWTQSISGNFYYLAHVEATAFALAALLEWRGRRRPWVVGLTIAMASLARPTLLVAAIPFGLALIAIDRRRLWTAVSFGFPLALAILATAAYDIVRFGSPLETGYGIAVLQRQSLEEQRAKGIFSLRHLPDNLGLLVARGFDVRDRFPWLVPDPNGHSILLTSPALLLAVRAGVRSRSAQVMWAAALLVAIPVLLYYGGGGYRTYGYRYALDFMPFLLALVAIGAKRGFGRLAKALIALSVGFVAYGVVWAVIG